MSTVYKYRVYCTADAKYESLWSESEPLVCPVNTNHSIDIGKTVIIDTINSNIVTIKDENVPTGGNYQCTSIQIDALANNITIKDISWPHAISVYSITFTTKPEHEGHIVNMYGMPQYPIGATVAPVSVGAKQFVVSSTVLLYIQIGYRMHITDGIKFDDVGMVLNIDKNTSVITTDTPATHNYSPLSPTYVKMCIHRIKDFIIGPAGKYTIGKIKTIGSSLPPGLIIRTTYQNKSNQAITIIGNVEYTY